MHLSNSKISRDISVNGLDRREIGVRFSARARDTAYELAVGPLHLVPGAVSPGIKRPRREADHSTSSSADVKNTWIYTSTPPYVFTAWCLIN
jgi:hypothetical protein